ncbi:MAG: uroporphyrinogen-III synthase [Nitriliruptorales bacterium]|nr:uroporphyrinogen-III synthase [Nitriliruptorales bacterium]
MDGLRIGVTGARKAHQLATALERRGAIPVVAPLVTSDVPADDEVILAEIDRLIAAEPEWFAASTGVGMRLVAEVADRHGRSDELQAVMERARLVARGAKAVGGFAAFGLRPEHVTDSETDQEVVDWLLDHADQGDTVGVQVHGGSAAGRSGSYAPLAEAGIETVELAPYVAGRLPEDEIRARSLVEAVASGALDVVTFTSPGAARNLFGLAHDMGMGDELDEALGGEVAVAVIGPVTGEVFTERGVPIAVAPERHRQGELVRAIERWARTRS